MRFCSEAMLPPLGPSSLSRYRIDRAFAQRQLTPNIVLEAIDSDVIKTYVRLGLGIGIVAEMAMREDPPGGELVSRPLGHLLGQNVARIAFKRGAYLRKQLLQLSEEFGLAGERGNGLLRALLLGKDIGGQLVEAAREMNPTGLLLNAPRPNILRFMPALNVTTEEIDTMIGMLRTLLKAHA